MTEEKLKELNEARAQLLEFVSANGAKFADGNESKPFTGSLSPGCSRCVKGTWSCIYINGLCTRKCFYCPQDMSVQAERQPYVENHMTLHSVEDYLEFLRAYSFEGVSFSGGEPFLVLDKVLEYTEGIRREFGSSHYIWLYTNGDLATDERLLALKEAGLDEIRFDLSARDYDLVPVDRALNYFETVTVEIPAIPEDIDRVKSIIERLDSIGVSHLNLHQLMQNKNNMQAFESRKYSITHRQRYETFFPVIESELTALEIIKHALEVGIDLSINYCSKCYKDRFQMLGFRNRFVPDLPAEGEEVTETSFLREMYICENGEKRKISSEEFGRLLDSDSFVSITIVYFTVSMYGPEDECDGDSVRVQFGESGAQIGKQKTLSYEIHNKTAALMFHNLFIECRNREQTADSLISRYKLDESAGIEVLSDVEAFYREFEYVEYLPVNLPVYD